MHLFRLCKMPLTRQPLFKRKKRGDTVTADKYGLRTVRRSGLRSALLSFLLACLVAVLSLGVCIYGAVSSYLASCDDYYCTVATLEYLGEQYPNDRVFDTALSEKMQNGDTPVAALSSLDGVISYEPSHSVLGIVEGKVRRDSDVYAPNDAVLVVRDIVWDSHMRAYMGKIRECVYSRMDKSNCVVFLTSDWSESEEDPGVFQPRTAYLMQGMYTQGDSSYLHFEPQAYSTDLNDPALHAAARDIAELNNGVRVQMTVDLAAHLPFQRGELQLSAGKLFDETAVKNGEKVCVISNRIADIFGVSVGDSLPLSLHVTDSGIYAGETLTVTEAVPYTVVGVYAETERYVDHVFIPADGTLSLSAGPTGYTLGQFRLENRKAEAFYQAAVPLLSKEFRLTVYDQGYTVTATPYRELLAMAKLFLTVSLLVGAAVLMLFGYLFVARRKDEADTIRALGGGKVHLCRFFGAGALAITVPALVIGVGAAAIAERQVMRILADFAVKYQVQDLRYSISVMGATRTLSFAPQPLWWRYALVAAGLLAAVTAVTVGFALLVTARRKTVRKRRTPRVPKRTARSVYGGGRLKYAWLSLRRGHLRTAATVAVAVVATLFVGQLSATSHGYRLQLAAIRANTVIHGYCSNADGLSMDGLTVEGDSVQQLYESDLLASLDVSREIGYYRFLGVSSDIDGNAYDVPAAEIPQSSFAYETMLDQMGREEPWIATTSLQNSTEFYHAAEVDVQWLEGFDERCLHGDEAALCVLPRSLAEREHIALGSVARFLVRVDYGLETVDLFVVGTYVPQNGRETLYTPLNFTFPQGQTLFDVTLPSVEVPVEKTLSFIEYTPSGMTPHPVQTVIAGGADALSFYKTVVLGNGENVHMLNDTDTVDLITKTNTNVCMISEELKTLLNRNPDQLLITEKGIFLPFSDENGVWEYYRVIGIFNRTADGMANVYCSPANDFMRYAWTGNYGTAIDRVGLNSAVFTLKDTAQLDALRDAMETAGFSSVNRFEGARRFAVLDDKDYVTTAGALERQLRYVTALHTLLYVLVALIAFAAAFLMQNARKAEAATMRGLGTPPLRVFCVFLFEQVWLSLGGVLLGIGVWYLYRRFVHPLCFVMATVFFLCWLLGTAVRVWRMLSTRALVALSEKE